MRRVFHIMFFSLMIYSCVEKNESQEVTMVNQEQGIPELIDYNIHIKPLLSDRCFACHGPDKANQKAGLALHTAERAYAELAENPGHFGIVPNDTLNSEIIKRIFSSDESIIMPPPESNLTLTPHEKDLIAAWIQQGAEYKKHWSLIPVEKPEVPEVEDKSWVENPIDNFILAKLEQKGWKPEKRASKEKLIRRVYFDLTGLPPSLEEIDAFVADDSPDAYEKVVDKLLGSVQYAERMAFRWLDIARYADSHGYQDDFYRSMWPYREWVIEAYHNNKSFKQFLTEQLAGDLLPNATYDQILATAFNRNHSVNMEGGIIFDEFKAEYVSDRTNTFGQAVLGLTLECSKCHDHKYDPISQKEYFQVYSFFNQVDERFQWNIAATDPVMEYSTEKLDTLRKFLTDITESYESKLEKRYRQVMNNPLAEKDFKNWNEAKGNIPLKTLPHQPLDYFSFDDDKNITFAFENNSPSKEPLILPVSGKFGKALSLNYQSYPLRKGEFIAHNKPFSTAFWYFNFHKMRTKHIISKLDKNGAGIIFKYNSGGTILIEVKKDTKTTALKLAAKYPCPENQWTHFTFTYDGSENSNGFQLFIDGQSVPLEWDVNKEVPALFNHQAPVVTGSYVYPGWDEDPKKGEGHFLSRIDELYFFDKVLKQTEIQDLIRFDPLLPLQHQPFDNLTQEEKALVVSEYLFNYDDVFRKASRNYHASIRKRIDIPEDDPVKVMVMKSPKTPIPNHILERGVYDALGEEVDYGTPQSVLNFDENLPKNRLGLAKWLFQPNHPLTSRVAVNRYWEYIFGRGIVKTVDDFGNQGELPSHPELLEWLSATFMEKDWDIKAMFKTMVMSATYQQSALASLQKRERDPENIYLSRSPRYRLPIEMIRDQALAISGLLNPKVGGPSARPFQPDNLWAATAGGGGGPLERFVLDIEEDLYRRSLYTLWKRTVPPPSMLTFDAPTRDRCTVTRQSTNTPLQALTLLNSPVFLETARVLAQNVLLEGKPVEENIQTVYKMLTARNPSEKNLNRLVSLYEQNLSEYQEDTDAAHKLLSIGEAALDESIDAATLAAHTMTFSTIFNLDETITKE